METNKKQFDSPKDFRLFLQQEYQKRLEKNSSYSLRAYAKSLNINPGCLSVILKGQRRLTESLIKKLSAQLNLGPQEVQEFILPLQQLDSSHFKFEQQPVEIFQIMSEWHYGAICELVLVEDFKACPHWISKKLDLPVTVINIAVEKLFKYEFLIQTDNQWILNKELTDIHLDSYTSTALRKLQKSFLNKSLESIDEVHIDQRHHGGMTMAIDESQIHEAKEMLRRFRRKFCLKFQNKNTNYNSVYQLQLSFFPLANGLKNQPKEKS